MAMRIKNAPFCERGLAADATSSAQASSRSSGTSPAIVLYGRCGAVVKAVAVSGFGMAKKRLPGATGISFAAAGAPPTCMVCFRCNRSKSGFRFRGVVISYKKRYRQPFSARRRIDSDTVFLFRRRFRLVFLRPDKGGWGTNPRHVFVFERFYVFLHA